MIPLNPYRGSAPPVGNGQSRANSQIFLTRLRYHGAHHEASFAEGRENHKNRFARCLKRTQN